jgi:hypothetical protein
MTGPGPQPGAGPAVERYLAEVSAGLPGPARAQAGVLAELRSGPGSGAMPNGWIYHRHLVPLSPGDGTNVFYETW